DVRKIANHTRWGQPRPGQRRRRPYRSLRLRACRINLLSAPALQAGKRRGLEDPIGKTGGTEDDCDRRDAGLRRPGRNTTGLIRDPEPEIFGKHIELLVQVVARVTRVTVLVNPLNPSHTLMSEAIRAAARTYGTQLDFVEARSPDQIEGALGATKKSRPDAVL